MTRFTLAVAAVVAGLSGCASPARYVERNAKDGTGVVAIPMNSDAFPTYYYSEAKALIQRHVGPNFEIVDEKEVPVGQKTLNDQQVNNEQSWNTTNPLLPASRQTVQNTTTTQPVTEYRIWYRKKSPALSTPPATHLPAGGASPIQPAIHTPPAGVGATPAVGGHVTPAVGATPAVGVPGGTLVNPVPAVGPMSPVSPGMSMGPSMPVSPAAGPAPGQVYGQAGIVVGSMR
jgi:hypothetical protein